MKLVNVIPATKIPVFENQILTYYTSKDIPLGSLVLVDLNKRLLPALVVKKQELKSRKLDVKKLPYRLKPIKNLLESQKTISPKAIKLLLWMNEYYLEPIGLLLKKFLPPVRTHSKNKKSKREKELVISSSSLIISHYISPSSPFREILGSTNLFLFHNKELKTLKELMFFVLKQALDEKKEALFLFPDLYLLSQFSKDAQELFGQKSVYHSRLREKEKIELWEEILNGKTKIVFGTRDAIFLPFEKLGFIVLFQENSPFYKSFDQHPKFDARRTAEELAQIHKAKLILTGTMPSMESFFKKTQGIAHDLSLKENLPDKKPEIYVLSTSATNQTQILSPLLRQEIEKCLKDNQKVIIFSGRRGLANFIVCKECGWTFKCASCDSALVIHQKENEAFPTLLCHYCFKKYSLPERCLSCGGIQLHKIGTGSEALEKEIKKLTLDKTKDAVIRIDNDSIQDTKTLESKLDEFNEDRTKILIGTLMIKDKIINQANLVAILNIDTILTLPDFRQDEETFGLISFLISLAKDKVVIETQNPQRHSLLFAAAKKQEEFFKSEIQRRKELFYPPFSQIVTIAFSDKDSAKVSQKALYAADLLKKLILESKERVEILGPAPCFIPKIKKKYFWQIVLKLNHNAIDFKRALLKSTKKDWDVDVDPVNIL